MKKKTRVGSNFQNYVLLGILVILGSGASLLNAAPETTQVTKNERVSYEDLTEYNQYMVQFYTQTLLERDRTEVSFPYALPDKEFTLWLGYTPTDQDVRSDILVSHPQLNNLAWDVVEGEGVFLHQRESVYESIEDFLADPPNPDKMVIDSFLKSDYPQFESVAISDFEINSDQVDFIFTSFNHSRLMDGIYYFERTIDASDALLTTDNAIEWYIRVPELIEDQGFYLVGNINVNYRQY